jgi:TonB-linked SusC/RagA family outer membrane protein
MVKLKELIKLNSVILLFFLSLFTGYLSAQINGVVVDGEGLGLPGVLIKVLESSEGTISDLDGNYTINASDGQTIQFSFTGMQDKIIKVGTDDTEKVSMSGDIELEEVTVVGALGLVQDKRKLSYSVQAVSGDDLKNTQRDNAFQSLQGRIAGLTMTPTSGLAGGSISINLRGVSSIGSSNQPLIVMDGLPISSGSFNQHTLFSDANAVNANINNNRDDVGSRLAEINPNDIESISVLKGPEAAALYGNEGANGVILITTKKGKAGKTKVTYSNRFAQSEITRFPEIQQVYDRGRNGAVELTDSDYFGPKYATGTVFYDNIGNFFKKGSNQRHDLAFEGGAENFSFRLSASRVDSDGNIPTNKYNQTTLTGNTEFKLSKWLKATSRFSLSKNSNAIPPGSSQGYLTNTLRYPSHFDMSKYEGSDGLRILTIPTATYGSDNENSFFNVNRNVRQENTTRNIANVSLVADVKPWLSFTGRFGMDVFNTKANRFFHPQSNIGFAKQGWIENYNDNGQLLNTTIFGTVKKTFTNDFNANLLVGTSVDDRNNEVNTDYGEKFYLPTFNSINNTDPSTQRDRTTLTRTRLVGAFAKAEFGFQDWVFINLTGRNDWSSTLPVANRSYFYPSAGLTLNFTDMPALKNKTGILDFGKLRASFARVGNPAPAYKIRSRLVSQTSTGGGFLYDFFGDNPDLKPENVVSNEIGTELSFFKERVKVDFALYSKSITDQIVTQRLSYGTGFIFGLLNGGDLNTKGIDFQLDINPIRTDAFDWNIGANFTKYKTSVNNLPAEVSEYYDSDTWAYGNVRASAFAPASVLAARFNTPSNLYYAGLNDRGAGSATAIGGWSYLRNSKGDVLINPTTGFPITNANFLPIGDRNPDFIVGLVNDFTILKNFNLSFLLDIRKGGDIFNGNEFFLYQNGLSKRSLDREKPIVIKGVLKDGKEETETPTVNTKEVIPNTNETYFTTVIQPEDFIERDVNWLRLRDVTLRYVLPKKIISGQKIVKEASIYVNGTDLFLSTNYTGADPYVSVTSPATGGAGGFGMDFGKTALPKTMSLGLSVTF